MGPHFMLLLSIYVLYSNVTYIYPVSCLVEIKLFQNCFKIVSIVSIVLYFQDTTLHYKLLLLLLLLQKIGNARPGEGDCHPISPKTPAPQYQPIEERREREISWRQKSR